MPKRLSPEQLDAQEAKAKTRRDAANRQLRLVQAHRRQAEQDARQHRRLRWAGIAEQVGLFQLDDATLQEVLTVALAMVHRHGGRMPRTTDDHATGSAALNGVTTLDLTTDTGVPLNAAEDHADVVEAPEARWLCRE